MTKRVVVALLVGAVGLSLSSGLVASAGSAHHDRAVSLSRLCPAGPAGNITYTIMQDDIEAPQPIDIGDWGCNVDAVTAVQTELAVHIVLGALCRERRHLRLHG
jgi:hypothetical protein